LPVSRVALASASASNSVTSLIMVRTIISVMMSWSAEPAARRRCLPRNSGSTDSFTGAWISTEMRGNSAFLIWPRDR
jgi:hypothetical protein